MVALDRVVCLIDFSAFSHAALQHAAAVARWYDARLIAVHVFSHVPAVDLVFRSHPVAGAVHDAPELDSRMLTAQLEAFVRAAVPADVPIEFVVRGGTDIPNDLLAEADSHRADLIVMGTHGRSGFERVLLGSMTEKVLRKASAPVLVVPPHAAEAPAAPHAPFKRIVCPIDFSESAERALAYSFDLAQEADAEITLLHVIELPPELEELPPSPRVDVGAVRAAARAECLMRLRSLVPAAARAYCTVRTAVTEGKAHREIVREADACAADLIVMGVHGRAALDLMVFGSTTHGVVRQAACPVLTVHAQ